MIRRLGAAAWQRLHRLVYVATAAAALHFVMLVKSWWTVEPALYATLVTALLLIRPWFAVQKRLRPKPRTAARPARAQG
jgi:sulfoxide reductase heme-binding subunit YedZ